MGRPVDPAKEAAILEAARAAFLAQPYDRVSVEAVALAAGVSKVTVYARFGSKDQLFVRALSSWCDAMYDRARLEAGQGQPLEQLLHQLGVGFVGMLVDPQIVALWSVMKQAHEVAPDLTATFYATVIDRSLAALAETLTLAAERGEISCANPREAAVQFVSMVQGDFRLRAELGIGPAPDPATIDRYVRSSTRLFVAGLKAPPEAR
jgi:TetR/AcrR family transcriptional regulator, mexJK operon transcriptional repressor